MQHTTCESYLSMSSSACWAGLFLFVGVLKRMEWLLELMGHIRNVAYGATPVICGDTKLVCFCLPGTHSPAVCCCRWLTCWKLCVSARRWELKLPYSSWSMECSSSLVGLLNVQTGLHWSVVFKSKMGHQVLEKSWNVLKMSSWAQICLISLQATDFLFQVFAAAVVSWGDHFMPLLLGIRSQWFPWQPDSKPQILRHSLYGQESVTDNVLPQCLLGMSHSLSLLLDKEPWSNQTHKVSACHVLYFHLKNLWARWMTTWMCVCVSVHRLASQHHRRSWTVSVSRDRQHRQR